MDAIAEKLTGDCLVISRKLSAEQKLSVFNGDWFEACHSFKSTGTYKGDFEINDNMILDFVSNFKSGVVRRWATDSGFRLRADIEHWGPYAGWIIDAKAEEKILSTGEKVKVLMLKCNLSADAVTAIKTQGKEYFSIEYFANDPAYVDDQTGKVTANVLTGGAFTDSPFCQEVAPMKMSVLKQKQEDQTAQIKLAAEKIKSKEELSKMKIIVATLGTMGIKLSAEPSEDAVVDAIKMLSAQRDEAKTELSTVKAELVTVNKQLSVKESELKEIQETIKAEAVKVRETKLSALKDEAFKSMKLSKAELDEKEPAKQKSFVRALSLDDLSIAESILKDLPKKAEVAGVDAGIPEGLSAEEKVLLSAKEMIKTASEKGQKLSYMDALEKARQAARIAEKGGK